MPGRTHRFDIAGLQLSQLRVLEAIFELRSVRLAAERLCITPSAVSHALKALRDALGDELFIRQTDGMQPTPHVNEIMPRLREALRMLNAAFEVEAFEPAHSTRQFRIACLPFMALSILPGIAAALDTTAPAVGLRVQVIDDTLVQDLQNGRIDLAIAPVRQAPAWVHSQLLVEETMVFVLREGHPRGNGPLSLADLAALKHIEIQIGAPRPGSPSVYRTDDGLEWAVNAIDRMVMTRVLAAEGLTRTIGMTVPNTMVALAVAAGSDMIALSVRRAAEDFARDHPLILLDPPYPAPSTPLQMIWNRRDDDDAGHMWFRGLVADQVRTARIAK